MAVGSATTFEIDVQQLEAFADKLTTLNGQQLQALAVGVVNEVAARAQDSLRKYVLNGVNMQEAYYRAKTGLTPAQPGSGIAQATIYALASTRDDRRARLAMYDAKQLVQPASGRAKGNPARGIPQGSKGAGVTVEVMKGKVTFMPGAFLMPLKQGSKAGSWDGPLGLFTRSRDGKISKHRLGLAVYQVFRHARDENLELITDDLHDSLMREADQILSGALT